MGSQTLGAQVSLSVVWDEGQGWRGHKEQEIFTCVRFHVWLYLVSFLTFNKSNYKADGGLCFMQKLFKTPRDAQFLSRYTAEYHSCINPQLKIVPT